MTLTPTQRKELEAIVHAHLMGQTSLRDELLASWDGVGLALLEDLAHMARYTKEQPPADFGRHTFEIEQASVFGEPWIQ